MRKIMKNIFKISALSLGITFTGTVAAADLCNVTYQAQSNWGSGAQLQITVVNNGPNISNPKLSWNYSGSESLVSFWNASSVAQNEKTFTAVDNGDVSTGGSFDFNIIINNPGTAPSDFSLNGISCKTPVGTGSVASSSAQATSSIKSSLSSSKSSSPNSSSSASTTNTASWILDDSTSMLNMVTVKNTNTAEIGSFSNLQGSVNKDGLAIVKIDLNTVSTANTIRDGRIRDFLFETSLLPTLYYKVQLNLSDIAAIAIGSSTTQILNGALTLHGATSNISAEVLITKLANNQIIVSSYKPVLVTASSFDLEWGIDYLRKIRTDEGFPVSVIGYTVPIYFNLRFNSNTTASAVEMPAAPNPAMDLRLTDNTFGKVTANWADGSSNETAFLVRRNVNSGKWQKIQSLPSGSNMLEDLINEAGIYNYKVIALNGSVPSTSSPTAQVNVGSVDADPYLYGKTTYADKCAGCHGSEAKGSGPFPALNIKPSAEHEALMINKIVAEMPPGGSFKCDEDCAAAIIVFLKRDFWEKPVEPVACEEPVSYGARQLRLLTKNEYQNTINALFGNGFNVDTTAPDALVGNFINNIKKAISRSDYDQYLITAEKVAKWSADNNFVNVVNCNNNFDSTCATKFINEFAPKAIRRKLESTEISAFTSMANGSKTNGDVKAGMQLALETILGSPQFLYRHEIGEKNSANTAIASDAFELTSYEMATWLAYTYTATTPDATLLQKAADNKLRSEAEIRTEIARLVQSSQLKDKLGRFVNSWLSTETLGNTNKDATAYPGVDFANLIPLMQTELSLFFSDLMLDTNGKFQTLYNANYTYVNGPLANHYKIAGVSGNDFVRVSTSNRGGLIANGGFMSRWADSKEPSPIRRAVRIRDRLLCQTIPEIPAGVLEAREQLSEEHKQEIDDVHTTNRRKFEILTGLTTCDSCHKEIINPLGFGLEDFDSVGNPRTIDTRGNMISATGALYAPQAWNRALISTVKTFTGAKDLGNIMAEEPQAQKCLTQNIFRISLGLGQEDMLDYIKDENEAKGYSCEATKLKETMMAQSPRKMLEQLGVMDSVRYRKAWSR
jgi:hypothetical protein